MNKKGDFYDFYIIVESIGLILVIAGIIFGTINVISYKNEYKFSCEEAGFLEFEYEFGTDTCRDFDGNLHFVDIKCDHEFIVYKNCKAKEISIGGVFIAGK